MSGFENQTVFITGAARGIGAATAREVVRLGGNVALVGLEPDLLAELAAELGPHAEWYEADVTDAEAMHKAADWAVGLFGGIDVVMANAGIAKVGMLADMPVEDFEAVINVNLLGVWRTLRATLPSIRERQGHVVIISSLSSAVRLPLMSPYAASKAAVGALGDTLRLELAQEGVTVTTAYFSFIDTDMVRNGFAEEAALEMSGSVPDWMRATMTLEEAIPKLVRAIKGRQPRLVLPSRAWPVLLASQLFEPLIRRAVRRIARRRANNAA